MKTLILLSLILLTLTANSLAQKTDRWHDLIMDQSTAAEAVERLGKPSSDKTDSFRVWKIDRWLTGDIRKKKWHCLEFKNFEDFNKVTLAFDASDKLVFIELNPKKLDPDVLQGAYGLDFTVAADNMMAAFDPGHRSPEGTIKTFPSFYYLYAKSPNTFLLASVTNSSVGSILMGPKTNDGTGYPGKVVQLQIVSRTLENKDGVTQLN